MTSRFVQKPPRIPAHADVAHGPAFALDNAANVPSGWLPKNDAIGGEMNIRREEAAMHDKALAHRAPVAAESGFARKVVLFKIDSA